MTGATDLIDPLTFSVAVLVLVLVAAAVIVVTEWQRLGGHMPASISAYQIGVWLCVGFFTGTGWSFGAWLVARVLR